MSKRYQVCGIGNGILDILVKVDEPTFNQFEFERGTMRLVDLPEQQQLLERLKSLKQSLVSGGSVANSLIALAQLGGKGSMICQLGDDAYGLHYEREFSELGLDLATPLAVGKRTGTCAVLVTPDSERTMRTCLGVSAELGPNDIDEQIIKESEWIFIEGYLLANDGAAPEAVKRSIALAKKHGTKVAFTCSEAFIIQVFGERVRDVLPQCDLVFANESEALAYTGAADREAAFQRLQEMFPSAVMTAGEHGSYLWHGGQEFRVPAFSCSPVDLTGAGDIFAGTILYGLTNGTEIEVCARAANYLAMQVITRIGARLHTGTREFWDLAVAGKV